MAVQSLSERLLHTCAACGGSCQGVAVVLTSADEQARIAGFAQDMGIEAPFDGKGRLTRARGRCVFLNDQGLCRIHATHGYMAKPAVCRQYPLVAVRVGPDVRVGLDPGCYTHAQSWRTGPQVPTQDLMASAVELPPQEAAFEERVVDLLQAPGMTLAQAASVLTGEPTTGTDLPRAFAARCVRLAADASLREKVADPATGPLFRRELLAVLDHTMGLDPDALPPWPVLPPEGEAYALDALSRLVWLRLARAIPSVAGVAGLGMMGLVLCAWAAPDHAAFGRMTAAWFRAMRSPVFWGHLLPTADRLAHLLRGR